MTTELAVLEADETPVAAPLTLFGTQDPAAIVARASEVATALAGVINSRGLYKRIRDRDHIFVEGWTLLGSMLGVFAEVEWSRPVDGGWEARAVARTLGGNVVGAAEAMCTKSEGTWKGRDEHAIRSMAQTRAVSKALRLPLGFIIELAGYSATPAEELNDEQAPGEREGRSTSRTGGKASGASATTPAPASTEKPTTAQVAERYRFARSKGWTDLALDDAAHDFDGSAPNVMSSDQWRIFATAVVKHGPSNDSAMGMPAEEEASPARDGASSDPLQERIERANARAAASKKGKDIQPEPEPIGLPL